MPLLVWQMGHVGRPPAPGSVGTAGEQAFTSLTGVWAMREIHGRHGWVVRVIPANPLTGPNYRGDAFFAAHCDGSTSDQARGASIGARNPAGLAFAQAWKRAYAELGWPSGFRPDNYTNALRNYYGTGAALAQGNPRAMIGEAGYLTSPLDRAILMAGDQSGPRRVVQAVALALGIPLMQQPADQPADLEDPVQIVTVWEGTPENRVARTGVVIGSKIKELTELASKTWAQGLINSGKAVEVRLTLTEWGSLDFL